MKMMREFKAGQIAMLLALILFVAFAPSGANAGWDDKSDELPGMDDSDVLTTTLLITAGVVVVVGAVYLISKAGKDEDTGSDGETTPTTEVEQEDSAQSNQSTTNGGDSGEGETLNQYDSNMTANKSQFGFYFGVSKMEPPLMEDVRARDFSDLTVKAGVTIGF